MQVFQTFLIEIENLAKEIRELREKLSKTADLKLPEPRKSLASLSEIAWKLKILEGSSERILSLAHELKASFGDYALNASFLSQLYALAQGISSSPEEPIDRIATEALRNSLKARAICALLSAAGSAKFRQEQWFGEVSIGEISQELEEAFKRFKSIVMDRGLAVPIKGLKGPRGLLYIETENRGPQEMEFAEAVASIVGLALEAREMAGELEKTLYELAKLQAIKEQEELEKDYIRALFSRFVSLQVVEKLASDPSILRLGGVRQEITILFADIRGFTALSEKLPPEDLVKTLNQYLSIAANAILEEEGTLDKFLGDAVMAFFNAPFPQEQHVLKGARAALRIKNRLEELHSRNALPLKLYFGIGLNVGEAVIGNIGTSMQMNYTAIGDCVNVAKRLQEIARPGQILISAAVYERIKDKAFVRTLPPTSIPGKSSREPVYELLDLVE